MKRFAVLIIILIALLALYGCAAILEGEKTSQTRHLAQPYERPPEVKIEVSDYDELMSAILNFVMEHESSGEIVINSYEGGAVQDDVDRACGELTKSHPVGAFAVEEITAVVTRIVSYFEIDISIEYKRTKQQIENVNDANVSTQRYLRTELLSIMSDYLEEAAFRATLNITAEDIIELISEAYYQNPRTVLMLPVTAVEIYPPDGDDRIFELHFGYVDRPDILRPYSLSLALSVRRNAEAAEGENDAEILISLAENLMGACVYDEGMARAISEHGAQNYSATAYGALVKASAVGEGFAMAYKALCDELGFDCRVVLGSRDGMLHAWNIVSLYGHYYHIDVAMCAANGIETAFLKTDSDFTEHYSWDGFNTVKCNGPLTYEDFVFIEEDTTDDLLDGDEENPDEERSEAGEEAGGEVGDETGTEAGGGIETPGQTNEDPTQEDGQND